MSTYTVDTTTDTVDAGDGVLSLREALALADSDPATSDTILFADAVQGRAIVLAGSQLTVASDVTIDGGTGVTIDAHHASRVLLVQGFGSDVRLQHLTITGGRTTGDYDGGAGVHADQYTTLTVDHATVRGNRATGNYAEGGGILGDSVTLTDSRVIHNRVPGQGAHGGGISGGYGSITLNNSTVSGNEVQGKYARGGAIALDQNNTDGSVTLSHSEISHNSAAGYDAHVGGIAGGTALGASYTEIFGSTVALTNSTVSDNNGGGIYGIVLTVASSTVSGNRGGVGIVGNTVTVNNTTVSGNNGGVIVSGFSAPYITTFGALHINSSTISGNTSQHDLGGVNLSSVHAYIANTIIAGNSGAGEPSDIDILNPITVASNGHNIFGSAVEGAAASDFQNIPASLLFAGSLTNHGGPTQTLALRNAPDNPALDGADPVDSPAVDQRGEVRPQPDATDPDIGAFKSAWAPAAPQRPFDGLEYIASYADLIQAFGPNEAAGVTHYHVYGASEGRQVSFDGLQYIASHTDLIRAFGPDTDAGSRHYILYGADEHRAPDDFDEQQYLAKYPDLQAAFGNDTEAATRHFITYGYAEGRTDEAPAVAPDFLL